MSPIDKKDRIGTDRIEGPLPKWIKMDQNESWTQAATVHSLRGK